MKRVLVLLSGLAAVVAAVIKQTEGRVTHLTRGQAALVSRIRAAAPTIGLWPAYKVALAYQRREARKEPTEDLDLLLAFAPWRSPRRYRLFEEWVSEHRPQWVGERTTPVSLEGGLEVSVPMAEGMWLGVQALAAFASRAAADKAVQKIYEAGVLFAEARARAEAWVKDWLGRNLMVDAHADNAEGGSEEEPNGG